MPTMKRADRGAEQRDQVEHRHDHGQGERRRHPEDLQDDEGDDAGDRRLRERPADVAGDRDRHPVQRPADRRRLLGPPGREDRLGPLLAPRDHEDAHHQDREQREERSEQSGAEVGERPGDVVERAGRVVGDIFELADQVEVLVQVPERLAALDGVVEVGDVAREVGDEVAGSGHGRRDEDRTEQDRDQDQDQVDERDRRPARHPLLEPVDRGRHRNRDEGRDEEPADRRAQAGRPGRGRRRWRPRWRRPAGSPAAWARASGQRRNRPSRSGPAAGRPSPPGDAG